MIIDFLYRFACHSQHPQGSWHLRRMVFLWQYRAVVHWNRGLPSVSEPTQITLLSLLFELSSCARFTRALLLVWDVARHGISTPFLKKMFFLFRYSFCHTSYLHPLPFSATTQVINNHTRHAFSFPMRQLYFVCKRCWTYARHVATLHEPCWGCHLLESSGWEFWTPGRGRSAWWRHPCWMFILIFFIELDSHWILESVMIFQSWPIPHKLCIVNHQGWSSLLHLFKLRRWFFFIRMSLDPRSFWL